MVQVFVPLHEVQARHWRLFVVDLRDKCYMVFDSASVLGDEHREGLVCCAVRINPSPNYCRSSVMLPLISGLTFPHHTHRNLWLDSHLSVPLRTPNHYHGGLDIQCASNKTSKECSTRMYLGDGFTH